MKYSFVVPIYNDGHLAREFCLQYEKMARSFISEPGLKDNIELIFVNDGSRDDSFSKLLEVAKEFEFVKVLNLSRNFGQHIALTAGYEHALGDFVGMLNVDCEDPPSEIPRLIDFMVKHNFDIVTSLRTNRKTSVMNYLTSISFHFFMNALTGAQFPVNCSTLRVMNRKFTNAYCQLSERERYLPGLEWWIGFKHGYIEIKQQKSLKQLSSYNFLKRLRFALRTIISFSDLPLKFSILLGFFVAIAGFFLSIFLIFSKLFWVDYQPGYTSTLCAVILLGGLQISVIGVVGIYVGRILVEVQKRPIYLVKDYINFQTGEKK